MIGNADFFLFDDWVFTAAMKLVPDSPYGDVSGLPDPFHDMSQQQSEQQHNQQQPPKPQSMQQMSFEESLGESGYSTPNSRNRRVIREIIV